MELSDLSGGFVDLKNCITELKKEIKAMDPVPDDISTMIDATNILRKNEHLQRSDRLKGDLVSCYEQYADNLEKLLKMSLEVQNGLKDILREQNKIIQKNPRRKSPKRKKA